jgi:zinc protease
MGLSAAIGASAQLAEQLPVEDGVRVGKLPNGLTYYIRHNETPKGQADFYIAQKVGSILEEDNQRGLAHFLEHMCFNGTKNFPDKGIINWLESVGVKFGYNLNAYTSIDETVYNISSVPVARQSVQDSCLLILHDWACDLTLDPAEIDAERGVIHEEWRRSMAGQMRILESELPTVYPNNKYGYRLPIGIMDVVDNFPPQAIIDYYHTWYRPDQQGIIVVGDIDVDYIEGKIKEVFSPIVMPENAKERTYLDVEDTDGTIYAIGKDPEQSNPMAMMFFKHDLLIPREMRNTQQYYFVKYLEDMVTSMLNARLSDIANTPDSPFAMAQVSCGDYLISKTKGAVELDVFGKGNDVLPALNAAYREVLRALRTGFTQGEYERATAELRSKYQRLYDSRNNTPTENYSKELVRAFIDNEPIPGIEFEKGLMEVLSYQLPIEAVNSFMPQVVDDTDNRVVMLLLPDTPDFVIPTEAQVAEGLEAVEGEDLEPYTDTMKDEPLLPSLPKAGKIKSEKHLTDWDATEYTLSNGVKVVVKPTDFKDNDIQFNAMARGGYSCISDDKAASIQFLGYAMSNHGLGTYTNSDLKKYLQGKQVSVNVDLSEYNRELAGTSTIQDLPTLMELIYATFTEYNFNADEFAAAQSMFKGMLSNQESTPDFTFIKNVKKVLYKAPAEQMITTATIDAADMATSTEIVKSMLANAGDFTFYFVGNIDLDTFKPLMLQYLATLPTGKGSVEYAINRDYETVEGSAVSTDEMTMTTPQTWFFDFIGAKVDYTATNKALVSISAQVLSKRLLNKIREEMGATYSIGANGQLSRVNDRNVLFQVAAPIKPEMRKEVFEALDQIYKEVCENVTDEELNPIKEYMVKEATASLKENNDWAGSMAATSLNGVNTFLNAEAVVNAITVQDVMNFWKSILAQDNHQRIVLNPAE